MSLANKDNHLMMNIVAMGFYQWDCQTKDLKDDPTVIRSSYINEDRLNHSKDQAPPLW